MIAPLVTSFVLAVFTLFLTVRWQRKHSEYRTADTTKQPALRKQLAWLSIAARVAALSAVVPVTVWLSVRDTQALADKTIQRIGLVITVGIAWTVIRQIVKVPIKSLWNPSLTWMRQIGLALLGGLLGSVVPAAFLLITRPDVRSEVLKRLFGK